MKSQEKPPVSSDAHLDRLLDFANGLVRHLRLEKRQLFNPFFWLTDENICDCENRHVFSELYYGERDLWASYRHAARWLLRNAAKAVINGARGALLGKRILHGELRAETDIVIFSWVYRKDLERVLGDLSDYSDPGLGSLYAEMREKGMGRFQLILVVLFRPDGGELRRLTDAGIIVLDPYGCYPAVEALRALAQGFRRAGSALSYLRRLDWALAFLSSWLNESYLSAVSIYEELSRLLPEGRRLTVLLPWEGQPKHLAVCRAFSEKGARVFGYINAVNNINTYLRRMPDREFAPIYPVRVFVHGRGYRHALQAVGWRAEDIVLIRNQRSRLRPPEYYHGKFFLPYDLRRARQYLGCGAEMAAQGVVRVAGIQFHPVHEGDRSLADLARKVPLDASSRDVIVGGFSNIIFEALEAGCDVYQILMDHAGEMSRETFPDLRMELLHDSRFKIIKITLDKDKKGAFLDFACANRLVDCLVSGHGGPQGVG